MQKRVFNPSQATLPLGRRQYVQIDENIFSFCLPEHFSQNIPLRNVVERINTRKVHNANTQQEGHIARRWWNLKEPGWFGRDLGSLMLNVELRALPDNHNQRLYPRPHDMSDRFHFLLALYERLGTEYQPSAQEDPGNGFSTPRLSFTIEDRWATDFSDRFYNNQAWTSFRITQNRNLIEGYAIPITIRCYLSLTLTYAPNRGTQGHYFHEFAMPLAQAFLDTLEIDYGATNPIKKLVETTWHDISPEKAITFNRHRLVAPLLDIREHC